MKITSVNVGRVKTVRVADQNIRTGIQKLPVSGPVAVDALGLEGDVVCNQRHHGGVDKAVYAYRVERLVRTNTLFPHSEKYRHSWVLPVSPFRLLQT